MSPESNTIPIYGSDNIWLHQNAFLEDLKWTFSEFYTSNPELQSQDFSVTSEQPLSHESIGHQTTFGYSWIRSSGIWNNILSSTELSFNGITFVNSIHFLIKKHEFSVMYRYVRVRSGRNQLNCILMSLDPVTWCYVYLFRSGEP